MITRLSQDQHWTTKDGETLRLEDMTPDHRRNSLCWLRRHAVNVKFAYELDLIFEGGPDPDSAAADMFDRAMQELWDEPAMQWLNSTPLVTRLAGMVAADQRWPR